MSPGRKTLVALLVTLALLDIWYFAQMYRLTSRGVSDFASFYTAGKLIRERPTSELFSATSQAEIQALLFPSVRPAPLLFNHLPYEALVFVPFSYMPFSAAYEAWVFLRFVVLIFACAIVLRDLRDLHPWWPWLTLAVIAFPAVVDLAIGQDATLLFLFYALAFDSFERNKPVRAGCLIALGLFKYQFVLPLLIPFFHKNSRKALSGFAVGATLVLLVSALMVGPEGAKAYINLVGSQMWHMPEAAAASSPVMMPNIRGLVFTILRNHVGRTSLDVLTLIFSVLVVIVLFKYLPGQVWQDRTQARLAFSIATVATLLVSYHAHIYDLVLLVIPVLVLADRHTHDRPVATVVMAAVLLGAPLYMTVMYFRVGYLLCVVLFAAGWQLLSALQSSSGQGGAGLEVEKPACTGP